MKKLIFAAMTLGLCALIGWGALAVAPPIPKFFHHQDKLEHILAFAALTLWITATLGPRHVWKAAAIALAAAVSLELAQGLLSETRSASLADAVASTLGTGMAALFVSLARRLHTRQRALA